MSGIEDVQVGFGQIAQVGVRAGLREERVIDSRVVCTVWEGQHTGRWPAPEGSGTVNLSAAFVRVSTGSQDETSQIKAIESYAHEREITIVKWFKLHGYSASHGTQEPALREAIADIQRGDYAALIVTESSRLDRREDLDAQAEILLSIRSAGGDIISISEPQFGRTDFAGRIVTLVAQHANAEKSRTIKSHTYRGISMIIANKAHHASLPPFWATKGERYAKQAYCTDPEAVRDVYERLANGESLSSLGRSYNLHSKSLRILIRFAANHTGVEECQYTHEGVTETWTHEVTPVVDSSLWWRANRVLDANNTKFRANKGGRPIATPSNWISGMLDCPACGGKLFVNAGKTRQGQPRVPKLRCGGTPKIRISCGRFKGCLAQPVIDLIAGMFASDTTDILAFQRVAGNAHELDALNAELRKIQARLSATEDDDELDALVAQRKAIKARIEGYVIVPDRFDYAPTGQTVAQMWKDGDDTVKRGMVRAAKKPLGIALAHRQGQWIIGLDVAANSKGIADADAIVDLGNGFCFRRPAT
ncbi:recombinase family protein [Nonomuraea sp. NN258]|uniref:recombinase family protein n=1 Tax=Nonomuraea antri TaxID=2730852 RepID=UPI001568C124|nr:recombinase family protein [Nonomuraea antri]NRQ35772.1 recombinase family protein [Nonomuraea antri]